MTPGLSVTLDGDECRIVLASGKDTLVCKVRFASGEPDRRARQERKSAAMDRAEELAPPAHGSPSAAPDAQHGKEYVP